MIQSVVVFTGDGEFKTDVPQGVFSLSAFIEHIQRHSVEVMSLNRVQFCVGRLETARLAVTGKTDIEHVQSLERRYGSGGWACFMSESRHSVKKFVFLVGKVALGLLDAFGAMVACVFYINWSAERNARKLCDAIEIGSDISVATQKVKDKRLDYGDSQGYTFYFWGMVFDKAVCEVSIDQNRKVTAKHSEMEYD
jgi:hypothetical protein